MAATVQWITMPTDQNLLSGSELASLSTCEWLELCQQLVLAKDGLPLKPMWTWKTPPEHVLCSWLFHRILQT
eukprot:357516-Chlamydomonas_euryale.AAC.18